MIGEQFIKISSTIVKYSMNMVLNTRSDNILVISKAQLNTIHKFDLRKDGCPGCASTDINDVSPLFNFQPYTSICLFESQRNYNILWHELCVEDQRRINNNNNLHCRLNPIKLFHTTTIIIILISIIKSSSSFTSFKSSSSSSAFNVRGPHITQAWDVRHPRWHGSDGCPQQHSVVSCTNSTTFNGSGYTRLCQGSSMNSWLTWGYWYMFLLLKELLQPDGLPAPTHPLGRGVFNETPSHINKVRNWKQVCTTQKTVIVVCIWREMNKFQ